MRYSNAGIRLAAVLSVLLAIDGSSAAQNNHVVASVAAKITTHLGRTQPATALGQSATQLANGTWLLAGGIDANGHASSTLALLDDEFHSLPNVAAKLAHPRRHHTATVLPDGKVIVIGGLDRASQPVTVLELFDPITAEVAVIGDVGLAARAEHTATLLTDGRVLITGGVDVSALVRRDAQLLDPQHWTVESVSRQMMQERYGHEAALLSSDNILLWSGRDQAQTPLDSVELFVRDSRQFVRVDSLEKVLGPSYGSPGVTGSLPAANAEDVAVDARVAVRFSKPLSVRTLNRDSVTLLGPNGTVDAAVVPAERGQLLFVTPERQLLPGVSYTLFIKGATDDDGQLLPFTSVGFTTRAFAPAPRPLEPRAPLPAIEESLIDADGELWVPGGDSYAGAWRSGNGRKMPKQMPKRAALTKALYGKQVKDEAPRVAKGVTALTGQVLKLNSTPLAHVTLSIGERTVTTDANGEFVLTRIPAGPQTLVIDGGSAGQGRRQYGRYEYRAVIEAGKVNALPFVIWMTRLDSQNEVAVPSPTSAEFVLTNPRIPGLELRVPQGTVIRDARGDIVTQISMTAIPVDQPPFPLPNSFVPVYFTIQPGGAHLQGLSAQASKGARLIYPNYSKARPGERMDFWNYDSGEKGWYVYGQGTVSADGKQIVPDEGVVIYEFSGAMIALPNEAPPFGPPPGGGCTAGDPVDCATGLFIHSRVDLRVTDVIPMVVQRTYRPGDPASRSFGVGTTLAYDMFLVGDLNPYTYQDLILPDGGRVHYTRTSPGTSWTDAVYESASSPGQFHRSTLTWNTETNTGWVLRLKDGTEYIFPEGAMVQARCIAPISMRDRYGNSLAFTRGSGCRLTTVTSHHGRRLNFAYDTANRITQVSDDIGRAIGYSYDAGGRLSTVTYPDTTTETYTYDSNGRMVTVTDQRGHTMVTNEYDANGRVIHQTYADNTTASFAYTLDANGKVTQMDYTDERGTIRRVQFNAAGYPTSITRALGQPEQNVLTFQRNAVTNLVDSQTDALGRVSTFAYDAKGNVTQITYLAGTADAVTWNYEYEPVFSRVTRITDPLGRAKRFEYDTAGKLVRTWDALNHGISLTYDGAGQPATLTQDPTGAALTTQFSYVAGNLARVTDPLGRSTYFSTDKVGRVVTIRDPRRGTSRMVYDAFDRLRDVTTPGRSTLQRTYDANGNLLTFKDGNLNITQFEYDHRNRPLRKIDALSRADAYQYDEIGNLRRITDRKGQVSGFEYDRLNRLTSAGFGASVSSPTTYLSNIAYSWDDASRMVAAVDSVSGTIQWTFDGLNRVTRETTPQGQIDYSYYPNNLRQTLQVQGQPIVTYSYDEADRLTQIVQGSSSVGFGYDALDRRAVLTLPNGISATYAYNDVSEISGISYQRQGATIGDLIYGYDAQGFRTSTGGSLARTGLPTQVSVTYGENNKLLTWGSRGLSYDDNGALTGEVAGGNNTAYVWDERGRLKSIEVNGQSVASFDYDALNRRVSKTIGGITTSYLHDGWQIVQELSGTTPIANVLAGGMDQIFQRTEGTSTVNFLTDALGSTLALTNASGAVETEYTYEPYGAVATTGTASSNPFQYTGRENDGTGLYYYRNRYYSPTLGRFISADPVGLAGGQNAYSYVRGNPVNFTDPSGLLPTCWDTLWDTNTDNRYWEKEQTSSFFIYMLRAGWPSVGENLDPRSPTQPPIWPGTPVELWKVEQGFTLTTRGVTTTITDIYKWQCTDEISDECGNKQEFYTSWNEDRIRSVNVKVLSQSFEHWLRWIERIVKIGDIPWPAP